MGMRHHVILFSALAICLTLNTVVIAQENAPPAQGSTARVSTPDGVQAPPKALKILREQIKPGKSEAHAASEAAWVQALKGAHYDVPTLAMTSLTGEPQVWFLVGFPSWAAYQQYLDKWDSDAAVGRVSASYAPREAEFVSATETFTCRYHREYSYQPDFNIGEFKYMAVGILHFRPGSDIAGYFKTLESAREKAKLDNHTVVYEVNSGAHGGTYLVFTPMNTMARWDSPQNPEFLTALRESNWRQLVGTDIMDSEQHLFTFSPHMSIPPKEIVAGNRAFWNAGSTKAGDDKTVGRPKKQRKP